MLSALPIWRTPVEYMCDGEQGEERCYLKINTSGLMGSDLIWLYPKNHENFDSTL